MSHIGSDDLIVGLLDNVQDVHASLRRLLGLHPAMREVVQSCKSWKYSGCSVLDVDVTSLTDCFQNFSSLEENRKSHLVILELLVDQLVALVSVAGVVLQAVVHDYFADLGERNLELITVCPSIMRAVVPKFRETFDKFLVIWGVGSEPKKMVAVSAQTENDYDPDFPCENCAALEQMISKLKEICTVTFQLGVAVFAGISVDFEENLRNCTLKIKAALRDAETRAANLEEMWRELVTKNSQQEIASEELHRQEENTKKLLSDLTTTLNSQHGDMEKLRCVKRDLEEELNRCEMSLFAIHDQDQEACRTLDELNLMMGTAMDDLRCQEDGDRNRDNFGREQQEIFLTKLYQRQRQLDEISALYDPDWKAKIEEAMKTLDSVKVKRDEGRSLLSKNSVRIFDLEHAVARERSKAFNLEQEGKATVDSA